VQPFLYQLLARQTCRAAVSYQLFVVIVSANRMGRFCISYWRDMPDGKMRPGKFTRPAAWTNLAAAGQIAERKKAARQCRAAARQ